MTKVLKHYRSILLIAMACLSRGLLLSQFSPADLPGLEAWFAADSGVEITEDSVSLWTDLSSNNRDATSWATSIRPSLQNQDLFGNPYISFDGNTDFLQFPPITNCRTIFWVARQNVSATSVSTRPLLGWSTGLNFLRGDNGEFWHPLYSHNGVKTGSTRLNKIPVNGTATPIPNQFFVTSLQTSENVEAELIGMEMNIYYRTWWGDMAEIIIFSSALSEQEIEMVEDYLIQKYGPPFVPAEDINTTNFCSTPICAAPGFSSYLWSTGENTACIEINKSGDYFVEMTDIFGRVEHDTIHATFPGNLIIPDTNITCFDQSFIWNTELSESDGFALSINNETTSGILELSEANEYVLHIVDSESCVYNDTFQVEVDSLSYFLTLGPDLTLCAGNNISIAPIENQELSFLWSNESTDSEIVINSTGEYHVAVTNQNNCTASDTIHVFVPGIAPVISFQSVGSCEDAAVQFTGVANDNIINWSWSFGDGQTAEGPVVSHTYDTPGDYTATLQVTAATGCTASSTNNLHIFSKPNPAYITSTACNNAPITFTDISSTPENIITDWSWLIDGQFYQEQTVVAHLTEAGFQNIILAVTDINGCAAEISAFTEVLQAPTADFIVSGTCEATLTSFSEIVEVPANSNLTTRLWNFGDDFGSSLPNPGHFYAEPGNYPVWFYVAASNGCNDSLTKNVTIHHTPFADFQISNACVGAPYQFIEESQTDNGDPVVAWHWIIDGANTYDLESPHHIFNSPGLKPVSLQITTLHGCSDLVSQQIPAWNPPVAEFSFEPEIGEAPFDALFINESSDLAGAHWIFGDTHESDEINPHHIFTLNGTYLTKLITIGVTGCKDTTSKIIRVAAPEYDLALQNVDWGNTNNGYQLTARLVNSGNILINEIMLSWQVGNDAPVTEIWSGNLEPGETFDYLFHSLVRLEGQQYPYICIEADPSPIVYGEVNKTDNTICKPIGNSGLELFPPFPNPGDDRMFIRFITPVDGDVGVDVYNVIGSKVLQIAEQEVPKGFHQYFIDISALPDGNYQLVLYMEDKKAITSFMKIHR
jgi:PKD repeat protein